MPAEEIDLSRQQGRSRETVPGTEAYSWEVRVKLSSDLCALEMVPVVKIRPRRTIGRGGDLGYNEQ